MRTCEIGQRIEALLKERKMTQKELAIKMGVNEATLSRYMNGERVPRSDNIAQMAKALNTTSDYLLGIEDDTDFCLYRTINNIKAYSSKISQEDKKEIINALFDSELNKK